ncbi:MAG: hypothetical protein P8R54_04540 [Myxococcota bacterium]|nr:hypothetical protein [Myxococcota bacterium]
MRLLSAPLPPDTAERFSEARRQHMDSQSIAGVAQAAVDKQPRLGQYASVS